MTEFVFSYAPWDPDQVKSLNDYQFAGVMHPFTCAERTFHHVRGAQGLLVATADGWRCPDCGYKQDWAHSWMADGSWRRWKAQRDETFGSQA